MKFNFNKCFIVFLVLVIVFCSLGDMMREGFTGTQVATQN